MKIPMCCQKREVTNEPWCTNFLNKTSLAAKNKADKVIKPTTLFLITIFLFSSRLKDKILAPIKINMDAKIWLFVKTSPKIR